MNVVLTATPKLARELERLGLSRVAERPAPAWAGPEVKVTLYHTGKVLVQGKLGEEFAARLVETGVARPAALARKASVSRGAPAEVDASRGRIGADEAGKGDYFGPLVVAAFAVEEKQLPLLAELAPRDSKQLGDGPLIQLAGRLSQAFPHSVDVLEPEEYNRIYPRYGNLNVLLADRYAETLEPLVRSTGVRYVICDKFGPAGRLKTRLAKLGKLELAQITKGERDLAVAAASILARAAYLAALERLSERFGLELRPGSGAPTVRIGHRFVAQYGETSLGQVAKLHFRTTAELTGRGS